MGGGRACVCVHIHTHFCVCASNYKERKVQGGVKKYFDQDKMF